MRTSGGGSIVELVGKCGRAVPMPDASGDVRSALLCRDERTRARTLVVEFPPGFYRRVPGRYQAGEELIVLTGELVLDGMRLTAGDWAWLPPQLLRRDLASIPGAVVYTWFSARSDWERSAEPLSVPPARSERLVASDVMPRQLRGDVVGDEPGSSAVLAPCQEVAGAAELLDLRSLVWSRLEPGETVLTGASPVFVRWPSAAPKLAGAC